MFTHLEIAEPYFVVDYRKCEYMVDEWLGFSCLRWHTEDLDTMSTYCPLRPRRSRTWVNTSFVNFPHSVSSNALSKLNRPLLPFRQLPVIFSSSIVCTFCTCIFILGPFGVLAAHRYRSSCLRASKYSALLQLLRSASSGRRFR